MDFFDRQEAARKSSNRLVVYFVIAVLGVAGLVGIVGSVVVGSLTDREYTTGSAPEYLWWNPGAFFTTAGVTLALILLGSLFKGISLSSGGSAVARSLGGHKINYGSTDVHERVLLNVVEEMSIAAGVAVPEVYMLEDEHGINAFAAGRTTSDAVIGVTRGCVKRLTRDELQGVVAHEFSHILNGDMRINLRLVGLLFGILMIALFGRGMLRVMFYSRSSRSSSNDKGGGKLVLLVIGLLLVIIGYLGVLMANLIKAAVSRQREFLADSSAVQFTRNPEGIGGALKKIGGFAEGSKINDSQAEQASHMFFARGLNAAMFNALATHPPIDERIRAIDPHWDGTYPEVDIVVPVSDSGDARASGSNALGMASLAGAADPGGTHPAISGMAEQTPDPGIVDNIGEINSGQVEHARQLYASIPEWWLSAAHSEAGAQALILAMLLPKEEALRASELQRLLEAGIDFDTYRPMPDFYDEFAEVHSSLKITLIDLAIPTLRRMSPGEYDRFVELMCGLIESDRQVDLFEFMLQRIVRRHLDIYFNRQKASEDRYKSASVLVDEVAVLVSSLAGIGSDEQRAVDDAFAAGAAELEPYIGGKLPFKEAGQCGLQQIDAALGKIEHAIAPVKKVILHACGKAVVSDGMVASQEAELLRAIADALDCPIPPFVA